MIDDKWIEMWFYEKILYIEKKIIFSQYFDQWRGSSTAELITKFVKSTSYHTNHRIKYCLVNLSTLSVQYKIPFT
jgi:hypothetical protein